MKLLVVEDDPQLRNQISSLLSEEGHDVLAAADGEEGVSMAELGSFDVMIVDRMLPKLDGLELVRRARNSGDTTPVLVLSALGQVDDRVEGLRAGGDDYLTKPYAAAELLARIEALGRRSDAGQMDATLTVDDLKLDRIDHTAERAGQAIVLQPREYRLLDYLMRNEGKLVTRTMLLQNVWDLHFDPQTNVIDVHMSRLRSKIDKGFDRPLIHTVRGKGYRFGAE